MILVDPQHKAIRRDARISWICNPVHKRRESRGLTSAGKQNRGLNKGHQKGKNYAGWKKQNSLSLRRCDLLQISRLLPAFLRADSSLLTGTVKRLLGLLGSLLRAVVGLGGSSSFLGASRGVAVQSLFPLHWLFLSRSAPPVLGSRSLPLGFLAFVLDWQAFALSVIASFLAAKVRTFFLGALLIFLARDPANLIMMVGRTDRSAQVAYLDPSPKRRKSS